MYPLLLLLACRPDGSDWTLEVDLPEADADECALPCVTATLSRGGVPVADTSMSVWVDDVAFSPEPTVVTDDQGVATLCPPAASLAPGPHTLQLRAGEARGVATLEVHPWGWDLGRVREPGSPATLSGSYDWVPDPLPFLEPEPDTWYAMKVTSPFLMEDGFLVFGAAAAPCDDCYNNPYDIGWARLDMDRWEVTEVSDGPMLPLVEGAWDAGDRNGPEVTTSPDGYTLWYFGRPEPDQICNIGRAFSQDRQTWERDPASPVHAADPILVESAHPTIQELDPGVIEMWYAGYDGLGFALSTDGGTSFTNYCGGPILMTTDGHTMKTPEVLWWGDRYVMTWGGGEKPNYYLGWAESFDGIRWTRNPEPILEGGLYPWIEEGVTNGQILPWMDPPAMVVTGTGANGKGGVGVVRAR